MRDGMIDAWDEHWSEMTSEGGQFLPATKEKQTSQTQQTQNQDAGLGSDVFGTKTSTT